MQDVTKLIEKYGPEISRSLGIASTQVYSKIIWYVRVRGLINFILDLIFITIGAIFIFLTYKVAKQASKDCAYESEKGDKFAFVMGIGLVISFIIWCFLCFFVINGTADDLVGFIAPEYWLIDQIVNKAITK